MSVDATDIRTVSHNEPVNTGTPASPSWGTATLFQRLTRVDLETAAYWLRTVARPAHRLSHPFLSIAGCPGCTYEKAAH